MEKPRPPTARRKRHTWRLPWGVAWARWQRWGAEPGAGQPAVTVPQKRSPRRTPAPWDAAQGAAPRRLFKQSKKLSPMANF